MIRAIMIIFLSLEVAVEAASYDVFFGGAIAVEEVI